MPRTGSVSKSRGEFPGGAGSGLFALQQACLNQTFDRAVTDSANTSSLTQANSIRIGQGSLLTRNRMVPPGRGHTVLIPPFPLSRGRSESVQHRRNLIVTMTNRHPANNLRRNHGE
jgi:hypothetical protein